MRKNRKLKINLINNSNSTYWLLPLFVIILILFNSLSLFSKINDKYLFLATNKITIPIFIKTNNTSTETYAGTKFAQNRTKGNLSKAKHKATENDSTGSNKVISLIEKNGVFELKLEIKETDRKIMITVYNLLAKKVLDVFNGYPHKDSEIPYDLKTSALSEGVYLCIIQGENFRLLKKFIVSR